MHLNSCAAVDLPTTLAAAAAAAAAIGNRQPATGDRRPATGGAWHNGSSGSGEVRIKRPRRSGLVTPV
ncbi:exported hypothetical protein [Xanthomonas phaseoli pv. phaseoli]|uniref:Secreted protein n=1 Tax=Xanthomonas campestris pv. phaseoli TaxID=317013 RepID=A0AB38DXM2_XANCH|nr:exported hypothetical protein [Xanthomonas phaseoli pv. phaseoli]SON80712.1 exported hypothetical protein [Xanthomonas phaseoli pv. phaseoli]SON85371.1 exported hypothetical protein [Xanthomonas phaseoli pv. phaseoli]